MILLAGKIVQDRVAAATADVYALSFAVDKGSQDFEAESEDSSVGSDQWAEWVLILNDFYTQTAVAI